MIARTAVAALPATALIRLEAALLEISDAGVDYLRASSIAFSERRRPASRAAIDLALEKFARETAALRGGDLQLLPIDEAERVFTLALALDQLDQHFVDLERCVAEHSKHPGQRLSN